MFQAVPETVKSYGEGMMSDIDDNSEKGWLTTAIEGGLPQILAGPAGKAISRLIGAAVEIPAVALEGVVQGIRDKSDARSQISQAIASRAAETAANDPDIMDRAIQTMLARSYRVQKNKDAVATIAIEELSENPPPANSEGPSDDWLNKFERHAEDASSDDLRIMFGKLLAGEVRRPGDVSAATLTFISNLDSDTAKLIQRVMPCCTNDGAAYLEALDTELTTPENAYLELAGFWSADKHLKMTFDANGTAIRKLTETGMGIAIIGDTEKYISLRGAILSRAGRDLVNVVGPDFDYQKLANYALKNEFVKKFYYGELVSSGINVSMPNPIELFIEM
ncbi:DUF2806 domain-containing protein [Sulfitobacter sp. F26169L]|uniref:DUF2806 domain-containing protein n=1 Tax=Sulfitobacter sp. F26169L TaxID=2996015 RepID=UPI002260830D|nr:DUF2806 domain-containing protein [Sulfitobacter sp. F26169L]MCX7567127.1 DUF2806 domain-containing protein [Sulfitobacter sp. F26169L]